MTTSDRFPALYAKYHRRVIRFCLRAFHLSEQDAEDLTQDVFLKFFESLEEYRGDAEWAYLETIARNLGYNKVRARNAAKRGGGGKDVSLDDAPENWEPAAPEMPDYADREAVRFLKKRLRDAMAALTPAQREALLLWAEGLKYKQIASILHITLDAVRSRLRDAKRQLQERLGDDAAGIEWLGRLPEE